MKNNNLLFIPVYNCPVQLKRLLSKYNEEDFSYYQKILIVDNLAIGIFAAKNVQHGKTEPSYLTVK